MDTNYKGELNGQQSPDHLRKMFIGGLAAVTTEDTLRSFYSQWGEVVDVVVMRDPATKRSRGFGFITYSESAMVDQAQAARPHIIDGKNVDPKRALPRPDFSKPDGNAPCKKIFVGGLKESHDEQSLVNHFSQFGTVVSVKILTDKNTGRKRGFAFVEFDDYDGVDKAVLHKSHTIKYVLVEVKKSVYKQELARKIQTQQGGMPQQVANGAVSYHHSATGYNQQAAYAYPQQMPAGGSYNGWNGYAAPGYPQSATPGAIGYSSYNTQNGANAWNAGAYVAPTAWNQNGYATPANVATPATANGAGQAAANVWNPMNGSQNFGEYQQTYNGGPQKGANLQGNRMNPYNVATANNYGYPELSRPNKYRRH